MAELPQSSLDQLNVCLINPAWLPEWFWMPTANILTARGANCFIPELQRGDPDVGVNENVDIIEATMADQTPHYIVALSRGVEFGVRYIDRLAKQHALHKAIGWMVISSVGPRGYEIGLDAPHRSLSRHSQAYNDGLGVTANGQLETIDPNTVETSMLGDIDDKQLKERVIAGLVDERPLSQLEIATVPHVPKGVLPLAWYIGSRDQVDNMQLSAAVARQKFGVEPHYRDWGHISPLTHPHEVAGVIINEAQRAFHGEGNS